MTCVQDTEQLLHPDGTERQRPPVARIGTPSGPQFLEISISDFKDWGGWRPRKGRSACCFLRENNGESSSSTCQKDFHQRKGDPKTSARGCSTPGHVGMQCTNPGVFKYSSVPRCRAASSSSSVQNYSVNVGNGHSAIEGAVGGRQRGQ